MRTDLLVSLDIIAPSFATIILSSKVLLPYLQVVAQLIAALFGFRNTHSDLRGGSLNKREYGGDSGRIEDHATRTRYGTRKAR